MYTVIECEALPNITNGNINCYLGPSNKDICNFTCDLGYTLTGSYARTCLTDGNWSGRDVSCARGIV